MAAPLMDDVDDEDDEGEKRRPTLEPTESINVHQYAPHVNDKGEWFLSELDLGSYSILDPFFRNH
jgi:hypothetical protein